MDSAPRGTAKKIGLGPRIAGFLRDRYSDDRAKRIAADFQVSVGTAKRWLRGVAPTTAVIEEMASRWNIPFVTVAFADYVAAGDESALQLVDLMRRVQTYHAAVASPSHPNTRSPVGTEDTPVNLIEMRRQAPTEGSADDHNLLLFTSLFEEYINKYVLMRKYDLAPQPIQLDDHEDNIEAKNLNIMNINMSYADSRMFMDPDLIWQFALMRLLNKIRSEPSPWYRKLFWWI